MKVLDSLVIYINLRLKRINKIIKKFKFSKQKIIKVHEMEQIPEKILSNYFDHMYCTI